MKQLIRGFVIAGMVAGCLACSRSAQEMPPNSTRYEFGDILNIALTPDSTVRRAGCFTDAGSWMGFTIPETDKWVNGFCGPFSLDNRIWFAQSAVCVDFLDGNGTLTPDSAIYFPGEVYIASSSNDRKIEQRMNFVNSSTALLQVSSNVAEGFKFTGKDWNSKVRLERGEQTITAYHPNGEVVQLTFMPDVELSCDGKNYVASTAADCQQMNVAVSFYFSDKELASGAQKSVALLQNPQPELAANAKRWEEYLQKVLRKDMKHEYDRVAVKSVVTLISNWRTHRGGLLHEGGYSQSRGDLFHGFLGMGQLAVFCRTRPLCSRTG